jgi:hypothetical protein
LVLAGFGWVDKVWLAEGQYSLWPKSHGPIFGWKAFPPMCGYPIKEFVDAGTEETFLQICAMHSTVIPPEAYPTPEVEKRTWTPPPAPTRKLPGKLKKSNKTERNCTFSACSVFVN